MRIPLAYNLRNLLVRKVTSTLTLLGIGLTIMALSWVLALVRGLDRVMEASVDPLVVVMIRPTSISETSSNIGLEVLARVRVQPEIATDRRGQPLCSAEIVVNAMLVKKSGERGSVIIRGVDATAFEVRPRTRIVEGRRPTPGALELVVGKALAGRIEGLTVGRPYRIARSSWNVVGVFEAGGGAAESEIWADSRLLRDEFRRDTYSSFVVRLRSREGFPALASRVERDSQINLRAWTEEAYYRDQAESLAATRHLGFIIAALMGLGAVFGAMNTMYSAVVGRVREIGTLRALGFSARSVMLCFVIESTILGLAGGLMGATLAGLLFHGQDVSMTSFRSFSEIQFRMEIDARLVARAFLVAGLMGVLGGVLPAIRAARLPIARSIREL